MHYEAAFDVIQDKQEIWQAAQTLPPVSKKLFGPQLLTNL